MKADVLSILVAGIAFLATCFSVGSVSWCETADFTLSGFGQRRLSFGLWRYNGFQYVSNISTGEIWRVETCNSYPDDVDKDAYWKAAQAFSIIAPVWGAFAFCPICMSGKNASMAKVAGVLLMLATLFQGLTLLILESNLCDAQENPFFSQSILQSTGLISLTTKDKCEVGRSAIIGIVAMCLYFLAGALALVTPVEPAENFFGSE